MFKSSRFLSILLSTAIVITTLDGCNVNINMVPGEGKTDESKTEESDEQITRGIPEETSEARNLMCIQVPGYTGLTNLRLENNEDGTYFYEDMTEDGITIITNMCAPNSQRDGQDPDAYAENFVCAMVDNDAEITSSEEDKELTEKFSYPVYKIDWESGENEDMKQAVGIVILTDELTYYFGYKCPIDFYEDNQEFYEDELKSLDILDLSSLMKDDENTSGNGEKEEIEIPEQVIEEMLAEVKSEETGGEKKGDPELNRKMDDIEVNYTMDDVAGYWIYEDFDEIYLALYDSGQFETYEKESGEVISTGSYEVEDGEVVITEGDEETQILQVVSMMTLMDDEGDLLTRYNPDNGPIIIGDDEAEEEDAESRLYGIHPTNDVVTEDLGNGWASISSKSRQVKITFPKQYRSGVVFDDTLYVYDGDVAYVTARNLTGEFNTWKGSVNSFKEAVGDTFIPQDFTQFYGKRKDAANIKRSFLTVEQSANCKSVMTTSCNMWNKKYDIQCNQTLLLLTFSDGAQQLVLLSMYHRWENKKSRNNVVNVRAGAIKNN